MKFKMLLWNAVTLMCMSSVANLEALSPVAGERVQLLPNIQKQVMEGQTLDERIGNIRRKRVEGVDVQSESLWRQSLPLVLMIRATAGEPGPWKVRIGKCSDLSDARVWYVSNAKINEATGRVESEGLVCENVSISVPRANLEIGTRYYWSVECRGRCGFDCYPTHGCEASKISVRTEVCEFVTEDVAPRWICLDGNVKNVRDMGGRKGLGGRRIRQGLVYRGQGLNDNSVTGETCGRSRLTVEDVVYLTKTLGIKTDLDLRGIWETADMVSSPLGENVKFILHSSGWYKGIFNAAGMKTMAENFRVFCDRSNYPIYFHCIGGADRTGALAYVLNAVLGVSRKEIETDWESTFYPVVPDEHPLQDFWCRESHFNEGFGRYGDGTASWNDRVVLYLKECGVTSAEIDRFREIMFEK